MNEQQNPAVRMQSLIKNYMRDLGNGAMISYSQIVFITVNTEPSAQQLITEYQGDVNQFRHAMMKFLKENEFNHFATIPDPSFPPAEMLPTLQTIIVRAKKEIKNGKDISFTRFLYHTLVLSQEMKDFNLIKILSSSGFQVKEFLEDQKDVGGPSFIKKLCTNFNELAKANKIDPVIGRDNEILQTIEVLSKRKKNNVVLLGKAGVGKTAIAEGLALAIVQNKVPESLKKAVVYNLEVSSLVAGSAYRGQFEEKLQKMIKEFIELEEKGDMPILFIDEIHTIMGAGAVGGGGLDLANIIKPALARGQLRSIGATTAEEWHKFVNHDKALKRRFSQVLIEEPTTEETVGILQGAKKYYEDKHKVTYSDESIKRVVDLSVEYIKDNQLPDKALDLLDYTGAVYKLKNVTKIDTKEVEFALSRLKNIPLTAIETTSEKVKLKKPISIAVKENLFGQDHAVDQVVKVIEKSMAGLQDDNKPMGQFLFVGPTGVGKTELAKLLATELDAHLERIDMSEYMEEHSVAKLIGAPPGYVGYDTQGRLNKAITTHGRLVLLLDEIEKAHPKVLNIFLQAMDNASVTDSQGEKLSFQHTLILMTSNAGTKEAAVKKIGFTADATVNKIDPKSIEAYFSPEFRNRLNGVVYFNPLSKTNMIPIVQKFVKTLQTQKLTPKGIALTLSAEAELWLVNKGYNPQMGGRPIARAVDAFITEPLTQSILYGEVSKGKTKVSVSVKNDNLEFSYN
jgi:ATP-dependent Clp protease ATP-binding subunit ClpA